MTGVQRGRLGCGSTDTPRLQQMCPSSCNWLWGKPALFRECHQLKPNEYFHLQLCHHLQLPGHRSCSFHCQGRNLGKNSLLPPTIASSFMQWSSVCWDVPWGHEGFTSGRCTLSPRDDFSFGSSLLWFLNATDRFVWSGTAPERGKSCPSGRMCLSSTSPPSFGVPSAEDPG